MIDPSLQRNATQKYFQKAHLSMAVESIRLCRATVRRGLPHRNRINQCREAAPRMKNLHPISRDSPAYYLTSVAKDRLHVFRSDPLKSVAGKALAEARTSGGFLIFAYVI